jgi:signal transduction histidine kinase
MEAGKLDYHFEPIQVRHAVERAIQTTRPIAGNFQVKIKASDAGKDLYVHADQTRLEQVITNILSNAIKFSHPGGEVLVEVQDTPSGVRVSVTDHGVGIPSGARDKVFAPFSQIDSSDTRKSGGSGLGLNIAKRIMDAHRGLIDYQSKEGSGSTFFIELDQAAAPA